MTKLIDIKKRAVTGHCTEENIRWLINEVEKLSILIEEKTMAELSKWSKESADKYIDELVDKRVKELTIKWESDLAKAEEVIAKGRKELIRAKKEEAELRAKYALMEEILKEIINVDGQVH